MDLMLNGKVVIITGGTGGIGAATANVLAQEGAKVVIVGRRSELAQHVVNSILRQGGEAKAVSADITDSKEVDRVADQTFETFGRIDVLINTVGSNIRKPVLEISEADWDSVIDSNLKSCFLISQAVGKVMIAQSCGHIIHVSSIAGTVGFEGVAAYCASKGGINQLVKALAVEWASKNINVNAVAPAYVNTEFISSVLNNNVQYQSIIDRTPLRRLATPDEVAALIAFLASDLANYITGQTFLIDGGWTII